MGVISVVALVCSLVTLRIELELESKDMKWGLDFLEVLLLAVKILKS